VTDFIKIMFLHTTMWKDAQTAKVHSADAVMCS